MDPDFPGILIFRIFLIGGWSFFSEIKFKRICAKPERMKKLSADFIDFVNTPFSMNFLRQQKQVFISRISETAIAAITCGFFFSLSFFSDYSLDKPNIG